VLAESETYETVEGNIYFPIDSINLQYFKETETHTTCGWKGLASYYTVVVDGKENVDAAWYYLKPESKAENIKNHVAFWNDVEVIK
jgi:uncharacterized protein (DUF427 family)